MERASSRSDARLSARDRMIVAVAVLLGVGAFVLSSAFTYRVGFPLDDSWIHAVYARNLAIHGEWAFQLGHPAAGSTSPLWSLLLVPGFWLGLKPLWWSLLLGCLALYSLGILAENLVRTLEPTYRPAIPWIGLFFAAEWHMLWAAASGMETLLHALLLTTVVALLVTGSRRYLVMGLLTGVSVWVRPDGLTLVAPVLLTVLLADGKNRSAWRAALSYLTGFGLLFLPFVGLNLWLSGTPMPNTFYAKQIEYAAWQSRPLIYRVGVLMLQLVTGPGIVLVPGVILCAIYSIRRTRVPDILVLAWCGAYFLMYMLRLPAYQHGRYLMPALPTFFLLGILGYLEFRHETVLGRYQQAFQAAFQLTIGLLTVGFLVLGARAYGQDVALIESEMVDTATWVAEHVPSGALVAAHDIGALGYFDNHPLLDLAGLVSPEVLPFMRDEPRVAQLLDQRGVQYLIAFPDLYPHLTMESEPIFSTGGRFAPELGGQNMTVYCWSCP